MKNSDWWKSLLAGALFFGIALGVYYYVPGWHLLRFDEPHQLFNGDLNTHYLGWAFFRNAEWTLPLGNVPDYFYPVGTNVGYTDSIPLLAVAFKLFDPWLPTDFQYLGWWLFVCLWLQMVLGWRLLGSLNLTSLWLRIPATLLIGISPIWIHRTMHPALDAHFFILAAIYLYNRQTRGEVRQVYGWQLLITLLIAWIHPYLATMVLGVVMAGWIREIIIGTNWRQRLSSLGMSLAFPIITLISWWLIGYFELSQEQTVSSGLGEYSANLNALVNPGETPGLLPSLPWGHMQYEGYAYLGLGGIILAVLTAIIRFIPGWKPASLPRFRSRWMALLIMGILMGFFALSPRISFGNWMVASYMANVREMDILHTFRSTGRFIWVPWYLLVSALLVTWSRVRLPKWVLGLILWGIVGVQLLDIKPLIRSAQLTERPAPSEVMDYAVWEKAFEASDAIIVYPPFHIYYGGDPRPPYLADLARRLNKPITMGYVARASSAETDAYYARIAQDFREGTVHPNHLYMMLPEQAPDLKPVFEQEGTVPALFNGYLLFAGAGSRPELISHLEELRGTQAGKPRFQSLSQYLKMYEDQDVFVILMVHDEGTYQLGPFNRAYLEETGVAINQLKFRGSYWGIMRSGEVLAQAVGNDHKLYYDLCEGDSLNGLHWPVDLHIESSGHGKGWLSTISLDGRMYLRRTRGFNVMVISREGKILDRANFDTYTSAHKVIWE